MDHRDGGPDVMKRRGWNSQSFKAGDQVAIDTHPAKKGIPLGISSSNSYRSENCGEWQNPPGPMSAEGYRPHWCTR